MIRKPVVKEATEIHRILNYYGNKGILLSRSLSELYEHLRDFYIIEDDVSEKIIAVCALAISWDNLAEIRSLAVEEDYHGHRYGKMLVEKCLEEAKELGLKRIFTLTYVPGYFETLGFVEVDKSELPHKVWSDCLKCNKFPDCDEIAMIKYL